MLLNEYEIEPGKDASYEKSREVYQQKIYNIELAAITDPYQYLDKINHSNYNVFAFGPISYSAYMNDEIASKLAALGFSTDLRNMEDDTHYFAMKDAQGGVFEKLTKDDFSLSGSFRSGCETYKCIIDTTNMVQESRTYSMVIAGTECGNQKAGLNIVVYDNESKQIVDKVNINTTVPELTMSRY